MFHETDTNYLLFQKLCTRQWLDNLTAQHKTKRMGAEFNFLQAASQRTRRVPPQNCHGWLNANISPYLLNQRTVDPSTKQWISEKTYFQQLLSFLAHEEFSARPEYSQWETGTDISPTLTAMSGVNIYHTEIKMNPRCHICNITGSSCVEKLLQVCYMSSYKCLVIS